MVIACNGFSCAIRVGGGVLFAVSTLGLRYFSFVAKRSGLVFGRVPLEVHVVGVDSACGSLYSFLIARGVAGVVEFWARFRHPVGPFRQGIPCHQRGVCRH